jgi:hypothetical protein
MHSVHVHFREQWRRGGNDWQNEDLVSLSALTNVARLDIPRNVVSHERPPVAFDNNCSRSVEPSVSYIVVPRLYGLDATVSVEYPLVHTLRVSLPKNVLV